MTRKEAIFELIKYRRMLEKDSTIDADPFDMAIEALEEVQKHEETYEWCHDCKEYDQEGHCCHRWTKCIRESVEELKRERKRGRWIDTGSGQECSICKEIQYGYDSTRNYCANCGADMRGDEDGV